jgi:serine/threonine protein phosphatase PrpC
MVIQSQVSESHLHAGCTAIVALKCGNTLHVANAGDSRGVLCRSGSLSSSAPVAAVPYHCTECVYPQDTEHQKCSGPSYGALSFIFGAGKHPDQLVSEATEYAGKAVALSMDHKPMNDEEKRRIEAAGGSVSHAGGVPRVNGNLNLSRAIGDLKYKSNKELPPEAQIITAHPDVRVFELSSEDQFFLLACDGVWDVLSNEVRSLSRGLRLQSRQR